LRIAYGDNYIQEVKSVHVNSSYLFVDGDTYYIPNNESVDLYNNLMVYGYVDLRNYKITR
jgi:hypothetical protein